MAKFKGKYRVESSRLQHWDYGWNGAYFITICAKNKKCYFGDVVDEVMKFSLIGVLADVFWHEINNHSKNVELGAFVVMPNHIHGILILSGNDINGEINGHGGVGMVETRHALSLQQRRQKTETVGDNRFQNQGKNTISSIVGSYKSAVSKHVHRLGFDFTWQPRFYDHIIRDEQSYNRIERYIMDNPRTWHDDKFYIPS
jgi:REP-associated tyrosine transposase